MSEKMHELCDNDSSSSQETSRLNEGVHILEKEEDRNSNGQLENNHSDDVIILKNGHNLQNIFLSKLLSYRKNKNCLSARLSV